MDLLQITASWFSFIEPLDRKIFFFINNDLSNGFFDTIFPYIRESNTWVPLYLFMLVFTVTNFGGRGWLWFVFFLCTVGLCDMVSSTLIKQNIYRLRPCNNPEILEHANILANYRPQSSSFTSSHATNHFGMAMFIVATLQRYTSRWLKLFFVWAAFIAFAQVYVGVHYPFDVFCGALLGCVLGYVLAAFFNNYVGLRSLQYKSV
jgi:membrane-associated phospholipid phosphatase